MTINSGAAFSFAFGGTGGSGQKPVQFIGNQVAFYTDGPGGALQGINITDSSGKSTSYGTLRTLAYTINKWRASSYRLRQIWVAVGWEHNVVTGFVIVDDDSTVTVGNANVGAIINSYPGFLFDFVGISSGQAIDLLVIQTYPG